MSISIGNHDLTKDSNVFGDKEDREEPSVTLHRECKDDDMYVATVNEQHYNDETYASTMMPLQLPVMVVSNKCETIFVSSAGDVLTSRCRHAPYPASSSLSLTGLATQQGRHSPYRWSSAENVVDFCCDADVPTVCNPWATASDITSDVVMDVSTTLQRQQHGGLYGGSPTVVATTTPMQPRHRSHFSYNTMMSESSMAFNNSTNANIYSPGNTGSSEQILSTTFSTSLQQRDINNVPYYANNSSSNAYNNFDDAGNGNSILLIKSFDYSQYSETGGIDDTTSPLSRFDNTYTETATGSNISSLHDNNNTMSSQRQHDKQHRQQLFHGIPTFLPYFSSVKIRHVSAHPMGAHVLLISQPGILYAYGLNTYGQLGIGFISHTRDIHQGYVMRPTIVTSLLENGGKTISCAAGASHSLVVVEVEEQRIIKSQDFEVTMTPKQQRGSSKSILRTRQPSESTNTASISNAHESVTVKHHQMYGFGRNDYLKIGLISPKLTSTSHTATTVTMSGNVSVASASHNVDSMECVVFPRRVALRCSVLQNNRQQNCQLPPNGIFAIAASVEHSSALVHQPNGDVELYTWGNATYGTLGLPPSSFIIPPSSSTTTARIAPHPSFVACLSKSSNIEARAQSLLLNDVNEFPMSLSLSRCCSFVVTNIGRCFSFGTSEDGMLGLGRNVTETQTPMEITMPENSRHEKIVSVCAGALHATICTNIGNVYSWGARSHAGFDIQTSSSLTSHQQQNRNPLMKEPTPIEDLIQFEWSPRRVKFVDGLQETTKIVQARTGNDCTFFVTDCGKVLSTGKSSGRFGQGEYDTDVTIPKPLFGGLHLFIQQKDVNSHDDDENQLHQRSYITSLRSKARRIVSA